MRGKSVSFLFLGLCILTIIACVIGGISILKSNSTDKTYNNEVVEKSGYKVKDSTFEELKAKDLISISQVSIGNDILAIEDSVKVNVLSEAQSVKTRKFKNTTENSEALVNFLTSGEDAANFYTHLRLINKGEDDEALLLGTAFNYDTVVKYLQERQLDNIKDFNKFLKSCAYSNEDLDDARPESLFETGKGNCNAFTLLNYIFLTKYMPDVQKSFIPILDESVGYAHILLKVYKSNGDSYTVDNTKDTYLEE